MVDRLYECRSNKHVISAGADKLLKVWDVASALAGNPADGEVPKLKATAATAAHDKDINAIAVAPNDSLICTGSQDRTAKVMHAFSVCKSASLQTRSMICLAPTLKVAGGTLTSPSALLKDIILLSFLSI